MSALLQREGVASGPGAQVEHPAHAHVQGQPLEGRELLLTTEEPACRKRIGVAKVVDDEDARVPLSPLKGEQREGVGFPAGPDSGRHLLLRLPSTTASPFSSQPAPPQL